MLRTCPRCGDYFAGDAPPFCPADGTPLADVDPRGAGSAEGARVVEGKARLVRRRVRRLKLRRVVTTLMTVIVTTLVVYVVAANYVVYLKPEREAPALLAAVAASPSPPTPTPVPLPKSSATPPKPTPTPTPTCTDKDRLAARDLIVRENRHRWKKAIAAEEPEIIKQHVPPVSRARGETDKGGEAEPSTLEYSATFTKDCQSATVTATYSWFVKWGGDLGREKGDKTVEGKKTFRCSKDGTVWRCR